MSVDNDLNDERKKKTFHFDRHTPQYREQFEEVTRHLQQHCPVAWSPTYGGHWVAANADAVFELARCPYVSNDHDIHNERRGYKGISIPTMIESTPARGGMLEMDDPEHRVYRSALNPYLSPAAVRRWSPFIDEIVRACLDEKIEHGYIDFVDDLANIVPAVLTLAMLGVPLKKWTIYNEPAHAGVYTPPDSPDAPRVAELYMAMGLDMLTNLQEIRANPRPGIIEALTRVRIDGEPPPDMEVLEMLNLLVGGGFDTTTALTARALDWLSAHPDERGLLASEREDLLDSATEEFLRYFTPAPGDARTIAEDCRVAGTRFEEGERLWLSWAMANRDPEVFDEPDRVVLDRRGNRHFSFGLGAHRCIGSNFARTVFKAMLTAVLDRMPDFRCAPEGTVAYDTIGVIQGMRHLPATFTPGKPQGPGLAQTLDKLQKACDEQELARPVTQRTDTARFD